MYYLQSRYYDPAIGRFINADCFASTNKIGFLNYNMFGYCINNPIDNSDPLGNCFYDSKGNWCHDNWEYIGGYERKPDPTPKTGQYLGTTSNYNYVYVVDSEVASNSFEKTILIIDKRTGNNPDIQVRNSYQITSENERYEIIEMIICYNEKFPSEPEWIRSSESMATEWAAHNDIYNIMANERCQHVDFDNNDEGVGYYAFYKRAIKGYLFGS